MNEDPEIAAVSWAAEPRGVVRVEISEKFLCGTSLFALWHGRSSVRKWCRVLADKIVRGRPGTAGHRFH